MTKSPLFICIVLLPVVAASAQTGMRVLPISVGRPHVCHDQSKPADLNSPTGPTVISYVVTADGEVKDPQIAKSSGNAELDVRATKCVLDWRYKPAQQNGQPVDAMTSATIMWNIAGFNR